MQFSLDRPNTLKYQDERILEELRRVAATYGNRRFTRHEFDQIATNCKGTVVLSRYGSWQSALDAAGLVLQAVKKDRSRISNASLFEEMKRVWLKVGHRPSKDEWELQKPTYSYTTYKMRFGGRLNACAAFIENLSEPSGQEPEVKALEEKQVPEMASEDRRGVPLKLRYRVLVRDNFRCVLCGMSPALESGVCLHIDHIVPFAREGKTNEQNLRTLCASCNWGKGVSQVEG